MMTTVMFSVIGLASELFDSRSMYMYQSTLTHMLWKLCALCKLHAHVCCDHIFGIENTELIVKYIQEKKIIG